MHIRKMQKMVHENAKNHGWWETKREIPELLCLVHSEVSEGLESYRNGDMKLFAEESADIVIRVMDYCEAYDIDLETEITRKHAINIDRPYRHGGKKC